MERGGQCDPRTAYIQRRQREQKPFHAGVHSSAVALTNGFDWTLLSAVLISSRDSHDHSKPASIGEAADANVAAVSVAAG
jgi:hypothetical protein